MDKEQMGRIITELRWQRAHLKNENKLLKFEIMQKNQTIAYIKSCLEDAYAGVVSVQDGE